ncbi:MAG: ribosome silencing factor [Crocinitomicaceae bacterium]|nr:ribosome silencing factor [Crocinitomicaceae bacterium]
MAKKSLTVPPEQIIQSIVNGMKEVKAKDIVVLDLRNLSSTPADFFVICHGTSTTQVEAISRSVEKFTRQDFDERPGHMEGTRNAQWILMDYFTVLVHIFEEKMRSYYDLEGLWADANINYIGERA